MKPQTGEPQDPPEPHEPLPEPIPAPPPPPPAGLTLIGTNGHDLLVGYSGADVIFGLEGDDLLHGGGGDDLIYGGAGSDVLVGNAGADRLDGGAGVDFVSYAWSASGVSVDLALGSGFRGDAEGDTYFGLEDLMGTQQHDLLAGTADSNSIWGNGGNDTIYGRGGQDYLFGGEGDDWLDGGADGDWLDGGAGEDTVRYTASTAGVTVNLAIGTTTGAGVGGDAAGDFYVGIENVNGSEFADVLIGTAGDNKFWGNGGDDQLTGGAGNDHLAGGDGNDALRGGSGADLLDGGAGVDTVYYQDSSAGIDVRLYSNTGRDGDAEGDTYYGIENVVGSSHGDHIEGSDSSNDLIGLGGDDSLWGGGGNDRLIGGEGDDKLSGGAGADKLDGGNGVDTVNYAGGSGVTVNLATGVGSGGEAQGDTYVGIENVYGSKFNDFIIGNAGNNVLDGAGGNDTLVGGAGQDTLIAAHSGWGPAGGHDILTGDGNGVVAADTFVIGVGWSNRGYATITDFQQGVDKIDLNTGHSHATLQDFGSDGELAWGFIDQDGLHGNALDASDKYFFDTSTHTLYECDFSTGTLVLGDALVTVGANVSRLQTSDFLLA